MRPDTPLEIQWLAYALAVNNAMDVNAVQKLHEKLGFTSDLTEFAEAVLTKLCEKLDPSEEPGMIDQVQQLVDYSFTTSSSGRSAKTFTHRSSSLKCSSVKLRM